MSVFFGVDVRQVDEAQLLGALAEVAKVFDESPVQMVAIVGAPTGPARWMSFRSSAFAKDRALAEGFFVDVLGPRLAVLVVARIGERGGGSHVLSVRRAGHLELEVRSSGAEVIVTHGTLAPEVDRSGDAVAIGLRALGWPDAPDFDAIGKSPHVVVLRSRGEPPPTTAITRRTGRLLPVGVIGPGGEAGFDVFARGARERFAYRAAPIVAARDEVVRLDVHLGPPARLPSLQGVTRLSGRITVHGASSSLPDHGVEHFDLGAVRELRYPAHLVISGEVKTFTARALELADTLEIHGRVAIELPVLRQLRFGAFGQEGGIPRDTGVASLALPALEEVKKLRIVLPVVGPFEIRLPRLRSGELTLESYADGPIAPGSVLEIPRLAKSAVKPRMPASRAASVKALLARR